MAEVTEIEHAPVDAEAAPTIWIEGLSRHNEVLWRRRCEGPVVRIGRGYDNDVIVDDPHVAANHLRIRAEDDGRVRVEDLGSRSGLFIGRSRERVQQAYIDGDSILRIGSTLLRVRTVTHVVGEERPLINGHGSWPLALGLAGTASALTVLVLWLDDTDDPHPSRYAIRLLVVLALTTAWTGGWAVASRIFGGAMRFGVHLAIACGALLLLSLYGSTTQGMAYALSLGGLPHYTYIGTWLLFGTACLLHLRAISPRHPLLKAATVAALAIVGISGEVLSQNEARRISGPTTVVRQLEPPFLRLKSPVHDNRFFAAAGELQAQLDHARSEEPPASGADIFGDD